MILFIMLVLLYLENEPYLGLNVDSSYFSYYNISNSLNQCLLFSLISLIHKVLSPAELQLRDQQKVRGWLIDLVCN